MRLPLPALLLAACLLVSSPAFSVASAAAQARLAQWQQAQQPLDDSVQISELLRHDLLLRQSRTLQQAKAPAPLTTAAAARATAAANQIDYRRPLFVIGGAAGLNSSALGGSSGTRGTGGTDADVRLSSPDLRVNDHPTQFFKVSFGGPTRDVNPLRLFSVSGVRRVNTLFDVVAGELYISAEVLDAGKQSVVVLTVPRDARGVLLPNGPATLTRQYVPTSNALRTAAAVCAWATLGVLIFSGIAALGAGLADANLPLESGRSRGDEHTAAGAEAGLGQENDGKLPVGTSGPMRRGIFAIILAAQWLYLASLLPGAPPNFAAAAGKFDMFSGNMRAPWQNDNAVDGPTAVGRNAAFVNNTAFAAPLVFQDVNMATMAATPAAAAMASLPLQNRVVTTTQVTPEGVIVAPAGAPLAVSPVAAPDSLAPNGLPQDATPAPTPDAVAPASDAPTAAPSPAVAPPTAPTAAPATSAPTTLTPATSAPTTNSPTLAPTVADTTAAPTPTSSLTDAPTDVPTDAPTDTPTDAPTTAPTANNRRPTAAPTDAPTDPPTTAATDPPSTAPTNRPTTAPTDPPTTAPTTAPTDPPTTAPTEPPTTEPTTAPTTAPTDAPTEAPVPSPPPPPPLIVFLRRRLAQAVVSRVIQEQQQVLQLPTTGGGNRSYVALSAVNATSAANPSGQLAVLGGSEMAAAVEASATAAAVDTTASGGGGVLSTLVTGLDTVNNAQLLLDVFNIDSKEFTEKAAQIAFWCGVAIAGTLLLHVAMIVVVRLAGWRPPAWLEFPRAELAVLLLLLQPIAQCTGQLVAARTGGLIAGGMIAFIAVCGCLLVGAAVMIWHGVHRDATRRARWQSLPPDPNRKPASRVWRYVAAPLAGLEYPEAEWVHVTRHRHLRFLERHGVLFEDNKGPLWHDSLVTPSATGQAPPASPAWSANPKPVDPDLYVVPAAERRVLGMRPSHLRPHATVLKVAVACGAAFVTVSITQKGGAAGVIAICVVGVVWLLYLRLLNPIASRLEQGLELLAGLCEVATWGLAVALLFATTSSISYSTTMGWTMLGLQGLLLALLVLSRPFAWAPTLQRLWARHRTWRRVKGGSVVPPPPTPASIYTPAHGSAPATPYSAAPPYTPAYGPQP